MTTPLQGAVGGKRTVISGGQDALTCTIDVPVVEVDLDRMRRLMYTVAYAQAADRAASQVSAEINLGDQQKIEADARLNADRLMDELMIAVEQGPAAIAEFVKVQEQRKEQARASLKAKIDAALQAGRDHTKHLGWVIKGLSVVKFASTVTIKTVSLFTGPAGFGIDVAYTGAQAGVDQYLKGPDDKTVQGVVVTESLKEAGEEAIEFMNELVAKGIMTRAEKNQFEGAIGNYKGNAAKLSEQLAKLEAHVQKALAADPQGRKAARLMAQYAEKLERLKALRIKTVQKLLGRQAVGTAKKALGRTMTVVFLASEVKDAWNTAAAEFDASN